MFRIYILYYIILYYSILYYIILYYIMYIWMLYIYMDILFLRGGVSLYTSCQPVFYSPSELGLEQEFNRVYLSVPGHYTLLQRALLGDR